MMTTAEGGLAYQRWLATINQVCGHFAARPLKESFHGEIDARYAGSLKVSTVTAAGVNLYRTRNEIKRDNDAWFYTVFQLAGEAIIEQDDRQVTLAAGDITLIDAARPCSIVWQQTSRQASLLLPRQRVMYAVGAFFLSHLLYTIWFASQLTLSFFWPLPLVLLVFGALLMAVIWSRLEEMKMPVLTFIGMTLVMVWLAGELWFARPTNTALSGFAGAALLLLSNAVWLVSHYRRRFRADNAIAAAFYFAGHFLIVRALYL